jgi:hypothetical protein
MKQYNVLIFPCGTEIANEIINSLAYHKYFNMKFASSEGKSYCDFRNKSINILPFVTDENFIESLQHLINKKNIDFIIPAHDDVAFTLSYIQDQIKAQVIGQDKRVNDIVRFKDKTYEYFMDSLPIAAIYNKTEDITFPLFVKPKRGQGSQDSFLIEDKNEFNIFQKKYDCDTFVWMEYLNGSEFTIDCFSDDGKLLYSGARTREKMTRGISVQSTFIEDKTLQAEFKSYATVISKKLNMHGLWFFQMKFNNEGHLKLLEVGPRVSGTMMLNRARGVNFVELALFQKLGFQVEVVFNDIQVSLARALVPTYKTDIEYKNLYIDFDDTLLIDEKYINPDIMRLIFQAKNQDKNIYLITKNKKNNLTKILHKFGIVYIFDDIIHIKEDDHKIKYMKKKSLLIDDSFQERKEAIMNSCYAYGNDSFSIFNEEI